MSDSPTLIRSFCELMAKRDADAVRDYFAPDATYQNTGMPAAVGVHAIIDNLAGQMAMFPDSYEYKVINLVGDGNLVLTERLDMVRGPDGTLHAVPVMGTFVVTNGKISRWTDYFDTSLVTKMMTGDEYSALVPQNY